MIYFQERLSLFYNNKTDKYSQKFIFFWLFGFIMEKSSSRIFLQIVQKSNW